MLLKYKVITALMALTGCFALLITGELNYLMAVGGIAAVPGYYRLLKGREAFSKRSVSLLASMALAVFLFDVTVVSGGDILLGVAHLTIVFQAVKSFDIREPWDHLQVYFVSLLQLVVASALTQSAVFGAVFLFFSVMLVVAMIFSHYVRKGRSAVTGMKAPVSLILILTFVLTGLIFMALPRRSFRIIGGRHLEAVRVSGFSDRVEFGDFGRMKLDPTVVMRIWTDKPVRGVRYWRGLVFDYFDGITWKNSETGKERITREGEEYMLAPYDRDGVTRENVVVEPSDMVVIFGLDERKSVGIERRAVLKDSSDNLYLSRPSSGSISYTVVSSVNDSYPGDSDPRYLQLPQGSKRIVDLARRITAGAGSDRQRAGLIERYLKANYRYSLNTDKPAPGVRAIDDFLFNTKEGYCQHYATAMVLMLRGLGIPARIVTGFSGGEDNAYGGYIIVRQSDAHSWVEAFLGRLWGRFDPTPPSVLHEPSLVSLVMDSVNTNWARYVVGFSSADQGTIARRLSSLFGLGNRYQRPGRPGQFGFVLPVGVILVGIIFILIRRIRRRSVSLATKKYLELMAFLKKRGMTVGPATTPGDIRRMSGSGKILEFIGLYEDCRFGGKEMSPPVRRRYEGILRQILKKGES